MSFTIHRLPDEPIIICTVVGELNADMMRELFAQSAAIAQTMDRTLYRITDNLRMDTDAVNFVKTLGMVLEASKGQPGSTTDPKIHAVLVANNRWSSLFRDALRQQQFGGVNLPIFHTLEDALVYVRNRIGREQDR